MPLTPIVPGGTPQPGAPVDAGYLLGTPDPRLPDAQDLAALGPGLLKTDAGGTVALAAAGTDYVLPSGVPPPGAPTDAGYLLTSADSRLSQAQNLASLGTGVLKTDAGVLALAEAGTDYALPGEGGPALPVLPAPRLPTGVWVSAANLFGGSLGEVHAYPGGYLTQPVPLTAPTFLEYVGIMVITPGPVDAVARLGLWADDAPGGGPGSLLDDAGTVPIDAAGWQITLLEQHLPAGLVWATVQLSAEADLLGLTALAVPALGLEGYDGEWHVVTGYAAVGVTAVDEPFPDTHPAQGLVNGVDLPLVWVSAVRP